MRNYLNKSDKQTVDQACLDCLIEQIDNKTAFWWEPTDTLKAIDMCNDKDCKFYVYRCKLSNKLSVSI